MVDRYLNITFALDPCIDFGETSVNGRTDDELRATTVALLCKHKQSWKADTMAVEEISEVSLGVVS